MMILSVIGKMNRSLRSCGKGFFILIILQVSLSCDWQGSSVTQKLEEAQKILQQIEAAPLENWSSTKRARLRQQLFEGAVMELLIDWALSHPQSFSNLLEHLNANKNFLQNLSKQIAEQGKSFVFLERFSARDSQEMAALLDCIKGIEQQDHRTKVTAHQQTLSSSPQGIAGLTGEFDGVRWQGAAFVLAQSECQLGLATAGHNVVGMDGLMRAPLANLSIQLRGLHHALVEVLPIHSPRQPEQDWTLLIANKIGCGRDYAEPIQSVGYHNTLPEQGLAVGLYCYHQGLQDVMPSLYAEQCRIYPTNAGVLDYYADKPPGQLGIHTCFSERGSSGCPILFHDKLDTYFLGTQIERDATTGAGIVRLFSDEFAQALEDLRERFARDDTVYRSTPLGKINASDG